jgi:aspartate aminotransferase
VKVSKLAANLIGSEIVKIGNEVNDLKAKGAEIANLTIGDLNSNIYPIPALLKEEIQKAYQNNLTNYPPANGLLSLRKEVSKDLKTDGTWIILQRYFDYSRIKTFDLCGIQNNRRRRR